MSKRRYPLLALLPLNVLLFISLCASAEVDARGFRRPSNDRRHSRRGRGPGGESPNVKGMIVTYWGQTDKEPDLIHACESGNYGVVIIAFVDNFGHGKGPSLNLAGHCDPESGECTRYSSQVRSCQRMGVKILISLGGADGSYGLESKQDAKDTAQHIWNIYLGGKSGARSDALGPVVLDGVDLDIERGNPKFYPDLAKALDELMESSGNRKNFIISAAPQCPFEDEWMGPGEGTALGTGVFDYVWVQFYNNEECQYNPEGRSPSRVLKSWKRWTSSLKGSKIFLGLPASLDASTDRVDPRAGFMPEDVLKNRVLPVIKRTPNYGGVMLWSYYYDIHSKHRQSKVYSEAIKNDV